MRLIARIGATNYFVMSILLLCVYALLGIPILETMFLFLPMETFAYILWGIITLGIVSNALIAVPILACRVFDDQKRKKVIKYLFFIALLSNALSKTIMYISVVTGLADHGLGWIFLISFILTAPAFFLLIIVLMYRWIRKANGNISSFISLLIPIALIAWAFLMVSSTLMSVSS